MKLYQRVTLLVLWLLYCTAVHSQTAKILIVVQDKKKAPIAEAQVKEGSKIIAVTGSEGIAQIDGKSKGAEYTFLVTRDDYEPAELSIFTKTDNTITTPPVMLNSLNDLRISLFNELEKNYINKSKISELKERIEKGYKINKQAPELKDFHDTYARIIEEKKESGR